RPLRRQAAAAIARRPRNPRPSATVQPPDPGPGEIPRRLTPGRTAGARSIGRQPGPRLLAKRLVLRGEVQLHSNISQYMVIPSLPPTLTAAAFPFNPEGMCLTARVRLIEG